MASATPSAKRRRQSAPASSSEGADLIGRRVLVPASVFPKEKVPEGQGGWIAIVTSVSHSEPGNVYVKFPGFGRDEYYFPIYEVREWLIANKRKTAGPAPAPAGLSSPAAAAPPSPAKSAAAQRPTAQKAAKAAAAAGGKAALAKAAAAAAAEGEKAGGAGPSGEPAPQTGTRRRPTAGVAAAKEDGEEDSKGPAVAAGEEAEAGEGVPSGSSKSLGEEKTSTDEGEEEEEEEEEGRAFKRQRADDDGSQLGWLKDGIKFGVGSAMTYVLLRWMYPLDS